jgi:hypothetical protein
VLAERELLAERATEADRWFDDAAADTDAGRAGDASTCELLRGGHCEADCVRACLGRRLTRSGLNVDRNEVVVAGAGGEGKLFVRRWARERACPPCSMVRTNDLMLSLSSSTGV